ncbi:MAG: hypothetical protein IPP40_07925 [bacterium]|nr:hypothetical protein [bacterium]
MFASVPQDRLDIWRINYRRCIVVCISYNRMGSMLMRPYGAKENLITATAGSVLRVQWPQSADSWLAFLLANSICARHKVQAMIYPISSLVIWAIAIAFPFGVFFAVPLRAFLDDW